MSQDHPDAIESNIETHPIKLAVYVAIGSVALVVMIIMLAYLAVNMHGRSKAPSEQSAMSPEATARRLAPPGQLVVDPSKKPAEPVATATSAAAPAAAVSAAVIPVAIPVAAVAKVDGKATYDLACAACHTAGIGGAPKNGDKVAWADRLKQGNATLYDHAIKGFQGKAGVMPAKGGNASLSDEAVRAAVDYMVATVK
jgi:cytochrome c5